MEVQITTGSNNVTYYSEITLDGRFIPANCLNNGVDEGVCTNPVHEDEHCTIGCIWHDYQHTVGGMCLECHKQWFFSPDWSSPACRAKRDRAPFLRKLLNWFRT